MSRLNFVELCLGKPGRLRDLGSSARVTSCLKKLVSGKKSRAASALLSTLSEGAGGGLLVRGYSPRKIK